MSDKKYMKKWRKENSEHIKRYQKQWRKNNSEHIKRYLEKRNKDNPKLKKIQKEHRRQRYLRDREKELKRMKQWKKDNPEKVKEINKRFYQKNCERRLEEQKKYRKNNPEIRRQNHKVKLEYVQNYKIFKGCQFCGYNKDAKFLGFHHPDDNKEFNVSEAVADGMSLKKIKKEIEKCIILCGKCHAKLHWELRNKEKANS